MIAAAVSMITTTTMPATNDILSFHWTKSSKTSCSATTAANSFNSSSQWANCKMPSIKFDYKWLKVPRFFLVFPLFILERWAQCWPCLNNENSAWTAATLLLAQYFSEIHQKIIHRRIIILAPITQLRLVMMKITQKLKNQRFTIIGTISNHITLSLTMSPK